MNLILFDGLQITINRDILGPNQLYPSSMLDTIHMPERKDKANDNKCILKYLLYNTTLL